MAKGILKVKEKDKATFFSPPEVWCLPAPSVTKPKEQKCVVDSGAPVHMLSRKDLNSTELETVRVSKSPITIITANGEVQTNEESTVYVKELGLFVTAKLFDAGKSLTWEALKTTDTPTSGPVVSYHISVKMTEGYNATRKNYVRSLSQHYQLVLPVRLQVHLRSGLHISSTAGRSVRTSIHFRETCCAIYLDDCKNWTENLVDEMVPESRNKPANFCREIRSTTSEKSGIGQAQYSYSLPEGRKLRNMQENFDYQGSLQKTLAKLFLERVTRFGNSMESSVSVKNKNFHRKRRGRRSAEIHRAIRKDKKSFTLTIPWNSAKLVKNYPVRSGSENLHLRTHFRMTVKPGTTSHRFHQGITFTVITLNQKSNFMCRKKNRCTSTQYHTVHHSSPRPPPKIVLKNSLASLT